jgi:hypothetical protein
MYALYVCVLVVSNLPFYDLSMGLLTEWYFWFFHNLNSYLTWTKNIYMYNILQKYIQVYSKYIWYYVSVKTAPLVKKVNLDFPFNRMLFFSIKDNPNQ